MTSDASLPSSLPDSPAPIEVSQTLHVRLKNEGGHLLVTLPPESDNTDTSAAIGLTWPEIWQQFKQQLDAKERFWQPNTIVHLSVKDRLIDSRQLHAIADALSEVQLQLKRVYTSRRQTAVAAATAGYSVEQQTAVAHLTQSAGEAGQAIEEPLYIQMTLRSGTEIRHNGTVVILGDLNPGSSVIAEGDILVWGRLRGIAHAGCKGNARCLIMALQMEPTQIRIADFVARAPETPPAQFYPEVAYVAPQGNIRIAKATDFTRQSEKKE
ncbi:septum site-determining protein MinC [Phormidesmis priestleyi]